MRTHAVFACLAIVLTASASCKNETLPTDLFSSFGIVHGSVTDVNGKAVSNVVVAAFTWCDGAVPTGMIGSGGGRTDTLGAYAFRVTAGNVSSSNLCLAVVATPPAGSGLGAQQVSQVRLTVRGEPLTPPVDSVAVDFVLTQAP